MKTFKRLVGLLLAAMLITLGLTAGTVKAQAYDGTGQCIANPATVKKVVHDAVTKEQTRWKDTVPAVKEVSHVETKFFRDIPEVPGTPGKDETFTQWYKWQKTVPTTVEEYRYSQVVPGTDGVRECQYKQWVKDSKTQYYYSKYTHTKTRTSEVWANFSPNDKHGTFEGTPSWPTDPNGTWHIHDSIPPGHDGADGVYKKGSGNGDWFYRHGAGDWSDYGPWTQWTPISHDSWQDFDQPSIGDPAFHADGSDNGTDWYREWQVRNTGKTRTVDNGGHWVYEWFTADPGDGWIKTDNCRWKVEPVAESTLWFPSEDGWTKEVKTDPWTLADQRTVPGEDDIVLYADGEWTKDLLDSPWVKVDEKAVGNDDAVEAVDSIPGYREYLMTGSDTSRKLEDAIWRLEGSVKDWSVLDIRTVVTTETVAAYDIYYFPGGEPTLTLDEENWTNTAPGEPWVFVDSRDRILKEAWTEKVKVPAKYKDCPYIQLAHTGVYEDMMYVMLAGFGLIVLGAIIVSATRWFSRRRIYK